MDNPCVILEDAHAVLQKDFLDSLKSLAPFVSRRHSDKKTYEEALKTCEVLVISGGSKVRKDYFDLMPNLKQISVFGVGYDGVDVVEAKKRNVMVTHTPNVMKDDVADTALSLLLNCARQFVEAHKFIEDERWLKSSMPLTTSLLGMKVGIVGLGRIGKEIARRFLACRCEVAYTARHKHNDSDLAYFSNLKDLASWAQALVLILPLTEENFHIVNMDILKALGPQGFLINVARGKLVDEKALIKAINENIIAGCGLDVFETEPCAPSELYNHPNVVFYPHFGSATVKTREAMANLVIENIKAYLNKQEVLTAIPEMK